MPSFSLTFSLISAILSYCQQSEDEFEIGRFWYRGFIVNILDGDVLAGQGADAGGLLVCAPSWVIRKRNEKLARGMTVRDLHPEYLVMRK